MHSQRQIELSIHVARVYFLSFQHRSELWRERSMSLSLNTWRRERIHCYSFTIFRSAKSWQRKCFSVFNHMMGIFGPKIGIKYPVTRSHVMFKGVASRFQHIEKAALEGGVKKREKQLLAPPNVCPTKTIRKQSLILKNMNSKHQSAHTRVDKHTAIGGNHASNPKPSKQCEVTAEDMQSELTVAAADYEEFMHVQHSLSSIYRQHSDIQTRLVRLMTRRRPDLQTPANVTVDGDGRSLSTPCSDYTEEVQQSIGGCQCCYHEENHHYKYDSHQLPGKLVNFIVLMAIFLHYAMITFIEPNYFDWFSFCCFRNCLFVISLSVQRHRCCRHSIATLWRHHLNAQFSWN